MGIGELQAAGARRLSALDAGFLYLERSELPLAIGNVSIFDGMIPFDRLVKSIEARLDLLPHHRQTVMRPPWDLARPVWRDDPHFDIRRHILRVTLDTPGTPADLRALAGHIYSEPLDRGKPLWELYLVEGLAGGRSALITKVHHAMVDGLAGVRLMEAMMDPRPGQRKPPPPKPYRPSPRPERLRLWLDSAAGAWEQTLQGVTESQKTLLEMWARLRRDFRAPEGFRELGGWLAGLAAPPERLPFNRPCGRERHVAWCEFSCAEVADIRAACGGTVNDVVLAVLTGALRQYLQLHHETVKNRFCRVIVPVSVRCGGDGQAAGNRVSIWPLNLPLEVAGPVDRLHMVTRRTEAMKRLPVAEAISLFTAWADIVPAPLQALLSAVPFLSTSFPVYNILCTNVPGPRAPLYLCGRRMLTCYPHVPTGYDAGVSLAVESYYDKLYFGLTVDPQAAPDGERLKKLLEVSLAELRKAAGVPSRGRRHRPGLITRSRHQRAEQVRGDHGE